MNPDAFIGITYPPDTLLASTQAREIEFNPKIFYASVGTAFPLYKQRIAANAEGVLGMGSWNPKVSPGAKAYFDAHTAQMKKEPDRWASGHAWAGMEILQQAVEKVGLDRKALREYIASERVQHHPRQDPLRAWRERQHSGYGRAMAERRIRGGMAGKPRHRQADRHQARLEISAGFSTLNGRV